MGVGGGDKHCAGTNAGTHAGSHRNVHSSGTHTLSKERRLALLVLRNVVRHMLLAFLAIGALLLGKVDLVNIKNTNYDFSVLQQERQPPGVGKGRGRGAKLGQTG